MYVKPLGQIAEIAGANLTSVLERRTLRVNAVYAERDVVTCNSVFCH